MNQPASTGKHSTKGHCTALWALALGALALLPCSPAAAVAAKPNLLILVADDLGYADVGFVVPKNWIIAH